jgi:phosphatidylglycerophosphate synthase
MITQVHGATGSASQEQAAGVGAQLILLTLLWAGVGLSPVGWVAGATYAVAIWAILNAALRRTGTRSLGPADLVTLARAVLVGGVTALVTDGATVGTRVLVLVALASVALVLDAVDGHVARRTGTSSALGARFDMEVDAFLILVLSIYVALSLGPWVLTIGVMRYAFVAAARVLPWLSAPLPRSFARKTVAALQGIVLVVAGAGVIPDVAAAVAVALALASLVWSFGRDIVWLWQCGRHAVSAVPRVVTQ